MMGVLGNSNPEYSGFEFIFKGTFPQDPTLRAQVKNDILAQVEIFENSFDIKLGDNTKFQIFPCENSSYSIGTRQEPDSINCIVSTSFKESLGYINPIFGSIIYNIWPKCPSATIDILSLYLTFKYLEIDPIQLATEIRYAYSEIPIVQNPDKTRTLDTTHLNSILLAGTRIYELEKNIEPELLKEFLYSCRFGINESIDRYFGIEFNTFVRSLRYETEENGETIKTEPSEDIKKVLQEIENQRKRLWKDLPQFFSSYDFQIRMKPIMSLYQSIFLIANDSSNNEINSALSAINEFFLWRKRTNDRAWIVLITCLIFIMALLSLSLIHGMKFKAIPSTGKKK
ncbi:MAG: hypothetical protein R2883_07170 [Caldisericia bacterium]